MQKISNSVFVETGFRGCNVSYVVTREGIVMIDSPMVPSEAKKLREELAKIGPVKYIINNEPHYDHITGDGLFGGTLIAHEGSREMMAHLPLDPLIGMLKMQAPADLPLPTDFKFRLPDITFSQRLTLHLGNHTFKIMHLPGHTPSETAVYVPEERVVFTSDNVVNPGPAYLHQAVPYAWIESLKQIQQLDIDYVVPGHGAVCDKSYLPKMVATVQNWIDKVSGAIKKGLTVEEALNQLTPEELFPGLPVDERIKMIKKMNIAHLYEVLNK